MEIPPLLRVNTRQVLPSLARKFTCFRNSLLSFIECSYKLSILHSNPFVCHLLYFLCLSLVGFLALKTMRPKVESNSLNSFDLFFMSVSALTVSSMGTMEMEAFSNSQLWVLIILMLVGGEVFTSMLGLQLTKAKYKIESSAEKKVASLPSFRKLPEHVELDQLELGIKSINSSEDATSTDGDCMKYNSIRYLGFVIMIYLFMINIVGSALIAMYLSLVPTAGDIIRNKRISILTFSIFTAVSSFGNCGFTPTNENVMIFRKDPILLLLIIPQILAGNTLFPTCLRFMIWILNKICRREEFEYTLQNPKGVKYKHLLQRRHSTYLAFTVLGFILLQLIVLCSLEWRSEATKGMSTYEKVIGMLFLAVNSRHAGESIVDMSTLRPAVLVLFIVMMYLPPYTCFFPPEQDMLLPIEETESKGRELLKNLNFSQLSYLVISIILICITERKALHVDPLNFNVMSIAFEVTSAYGNVGYSVGYSCQRMLNRDAKCKDASYGFVGRWSYQGKMLLIVVMFFGRLKNFSMQGGRAWKLS